MKVLLLSLLILSVVYTTDTACPKNTPGPDNMSLTDEKAQEDLMVKVFPSWKGKTLTRKDLSGAGGAKLFMYNPKGEDVLPIGAVLKISPPQEHQKEESFETKVTNAVACALFKNGKSTVINAAEGTNWKIQESAGLEGKIWNMQYPSDLVGELMARVHNTPVHWATSLFKEVYELNPVAKSWPHNAVPFWLAKSKIHDAMIPALSQLNTLELSLKYKVPEVSKRTVTIHGDFHDYNFLYADHKKNLLRVIDLDTAWVGNPLLDFSRNMWTMNLNFAERQKLAQSYLQHLGLKDVTKQKVYDMLYDAEVYKLFTAIEGYLWKLAPTCHEESTEDPNFIHNQLQDLVQIWENAGKAKKSQMRIIEVGIFLYAHETNVIWHKWASTSNCGKKIPMIQEDFRREENFTNLFELRGLHGKPIDMAQVNGFLSHFNDMFKPEYQPTIQAIEPWDAYYKPGGIKITPKEDPHNRLANPTILTYFGPVEGKKGRRFVLGSTRKSGYPYAIMTGWMSILANERDHKAQVWFRTTKWHGMNLSMDPHEIFSTFVNGLEQDIVHVWNANMDHPTDLVKHTTHKKVPAHKAAAHKAPAHKAPAHKAPAHKAPAHKAPAHKAPAHKAPVKVSKREATAKLEDLAKKALIKTPATKKAPAHKKDAIHLPPAHIKRRRLLKK